MSDYVRCVCGKLVLRETATKAAGQYFGPECWKLVKRELSTTNDEGES